MITGLITRVLRVDLSKATTEGHNDISIQLFRDLSKRKIKAESSTFRMKRLESVSYYEKCNKLTALRYLRNSFKLIGLTISRLRVFVASLLKASFSTLRNFHDEASCRRRDASEGADRPRQATPGHDQTSARSWIGSAT